MAKAFTRSPNYPAIGLREAIDKAKQLYRRIHNHPTDKENIAKLLGYSGVNGSSSGVISALQKFDLLEPVGDEFKVPEAALDVILHSTGDVERKQFIKRVAFQPSVFADLYEKYGVKLPDDNVIMAYLVKGGFNPKSVSTVIRTFRGTVEFVEEEGAFDEKSPQAPIEHEQNAPQQNQGRQPFSRVSSLPQQTGELVTGDTQDKAPFPTSGEPPLTFKIARDSYVKVSFSGRITQEAISKLIFFLENSKDIYPTKAELEQPPKAQYEVPRRAIWHGKDHDQQVIVTGPLGEHGGVRYFSIEGSDTGVPEDEIEFEND